MRLVLCLALVLDLGSCKGTPAKPREQPDPVPKLCEAPASRWGADHHADCLQGKGRECIELGVAHQVGEMEVSKSEACGAALFAKACEQNYDQGCQFLGNAYAFGQGVRRHPGEAAKYYDKACSLGERLSCDAARAMRSIE